MVPLPSEWKPKSLQFLLSVSIMPFIMCPQCILIFVFTHSPPVILTFLIFLKFTRQTYTCSRVFLLFGSVVKNLPASAEDTRDMGSIPVSGRCHRVGNGNLLQYSCLKGSMGRETWWVTVHGVTRNWIYLRMHACVHVRAHKHTQTHTHRSLSPIFPPCLEHS